MLADEKLPIMLVGCGNWGQFILRDLNELNCDVTVVCPNAESEARAIQYGAKYIVKNISHHNKPAGIVIATPTSTHLDVIESLLANGFDVPFFVEKPLGTDLVKARNIVSKAGEQIFIMDKWRYHPGVEELAAIVKNQELGEVIGLSIRQLGWGCYHHDVDFIDILLPHTLTITYEILGQIPKPQASYMLKRNDKPVAFHGKLGIAPWINFNVAINSPYYCREIIVECTQGVAVLNESNNKAIEIYFLENAKKNSLGQPLQRQIATELPLLRELRFFLDYLKGGVVPKSNADLGITIMEKILELRKISRVSSELN